MDHGSERHRSRFKAWTENHPAEPSIDAIVSEMFIEIEQLKTENEEFKFGLDAVQGLDGQKIDDLGKENDKLREALESIKVDVEIRTDFSVDILRKVILRYVDEALKDGE